MLPHKLFVMLSIEIFWTIRIHQNGRGNITSITREIFRFILWEEQYDVVLLLFRHICMNYYNFLKNEIFVVRDINQLLNVYGRKVLKNKKTLWEKREKWI